MQLILEYVKSDTLMHSLLKATIIQCAFNRTGSFLNK